jgi:hypothetical protein
LTLSNKRSCAAHGPHRVVGQRTTCLYGAFEPQRLKEIGD